MTRPFVHLHAHSAYSLGHGALPIKTLVKQAHQYDMPALALADRDNLFGALEFSMACADMGIQPLMGVDLNVHYPEPPKAQTSYDPLRSSLLFLAQNQEGYRNLMALASAPYFQESPEGRIGCALNTVLNHTEGVLVLTGGVESYFNRLLQHKDMTRAREHLSLLMKHFPDRVYIELMRYGLPDEAEVEALALELACEMRVPVVATQQAFFDVPERYQAHDALLCIAHGTYVTEADRYRVTPEHFFKSSQQMQQLFADIPEALDNTAVIAQRCAYRPQACAPILPPFPCESGASEIEELQIQAQKGLEQRLQTVSAEQHPAYHQRLQYELDVIQKMGFSGYFLIVSDFIKWAKAHQIPVGPGRGSGAGSLVAWALTITDIDPIRFQLLFERFLNPERVSMPDFDVDFCQDKRDQVIMYVREKYGADRVAHIITFGKLQARAVLRDVGRVLQMPYSMVDKICKLVPNNPAQPVTLQQAIEIEPRLKEMVADDPLIQELVDTAQQLEGLYRHASTHAAGVVIGDRPLLELVPLYHDPRSALPATQFNMKYVELAGLLKFDFLGLKTLTVLVHTVEEVRKNRSVQIDLSHIPLDDLKTFELLKRVETTGVFQLESKGMRDVVRRLQPDRFEELIALVALYRPGPMDDIPRYLACKQGTEQVTYLHPALEPILSETFGVMVYQEQVMQIAQVLGGYTLGQADLLRRAMGKKIRSEMDAQEKQFVEGATSRGVLPDVASQIFHQMSKFAGYGFNKSHSAPYALLAYQTAYLKAHYLPEFMCALMTLDMHNTDKLGVYVQELAALGVPLLPPDVNRSQADFKVELLADGTQAVRYGLAAIKNVGRPLAEALAADRQARGVYASAEDVFKRLDPSCMNKRQVEHLIFAGSFDSLTPCRKELFQEIDFLMKDAQRGRQQVGLFDFFEPSADVKPCKTAAHAEWPTLEKLEYERQAIGFYLSSHPLQSYLPLLVAQGYQTVITLGDREDAWPFQLAGIIVQVQKRRTKQGQMFAFIQLSDPTGMVDVAVFPELYQSVGATLNVGDQIVVSGEAKADGESYRLTAQSISTFETFLQNQLQSLSLKVETPEAVQALQTLLDQTPEGGGKIFLIPHVKPSQTLRIQIPRKVAFSLEFMDQLERIEGLSLGGLFESSASSLSA